MGQCRTLDADVTVGFYYDDYRSCDNTIPMSLKPFLDKYAAQNKVTRYVGVA